MPEEEAKRRYIFLAMELLKEEVSLKDLEQLNIIKSILPQVPMKVINQVWLKNNKNNDSTLADIVEGNVEYEEEVPLPTENESKHADGSHGSGLAPTPSPMTHVTKASTFEKDAEKRMQSYKERKEQLLEVARQHFLQKKHSMQIQKQN